VLDLNRRLWHLLTERSVGLRWHVLAEELLRDVGLEVVR
jgi:hypothetical protein